MEIFNDPKFESKEDWKKEAQSEGATVHSKYFDYGKAYVLTVFKKSLSLRNFLG